MNSRIESHWKLQQNVPLCFLFDKFCHREIPSQMMWLWQIGFMLQFFKKKLYHCSILLLNFSFILYLLNASIFYIFNVILFFYVPCTYYLVKWYIFIFIYPFDLENDWTFILIFPQQKMLLKKSLQVLKSVLGDCNPLPLINSWTASEGLFLFYLIVLPVCIYLINFLLFWL